MFSGIIVSVIKVEEHQITLENDDTGETYVILRECFPYVEGGIRMGQIFRCDCEIQNLIYDEEETKTRLETVASLLAQLHKV